MVSAVEKNKIEWKLIDLSDRDIFESFGENSEGIAMYGFASLFFWKEYYRTSYAIIKGNLIAKGKSDKGNCVVYFPRGLKGDVKEVIEALRSDCCGRLKLHPLTEAVAEAIHGAYPDSKLTLCEGKCEYVYERSDLALLGGKRYHAKRNHIAKFDKSYVGEYTEITPESLHILRECAHHLFGVIENSPKDEFKAILCAIDNFEKLKLRAGVLTVDGKYVAYSIGSVINGDTVDIHFEKADRSYEGSYAKINNCFARYSWSDMRYLNREEDLGIEGLRKAKLSYYPCRLNQMYTVELF